MVTPLPLKIVKVKMKKSLSVKRPTCMVCKARYYSNSSFPYAKGGSKTCSVWCENIYRRFFTRS